MAGEVAPYLVLPGDVLLVVLLHLPELGLQTSELDLHLFHVLQVPLGPLVQHLDGLGHVLDLRRHIRTHWSVLLNTWEVREIHMGCSGKNPTDFQYVVLAWRSSPSDSQNSDIGPTRQGPPTHGANVGGNTMIRHLVSLKLHKLDSSSIYSTEIYLSAHVNQLVCIIWGLSCLSVTSILSSMCFKMVVVCKMR